MRRIYCISYCRKAISNIALKIYFSLALIWVLSFNVSVMNVFKNTMDIGFNFSNVFSFYKYAFMHTELLAQTVFVLAILFLFFLTIKNLKSATFYFRETK